MTAPPVLDHPVTTSELALLDDLRRTVPSGRALLLWIRLDRLHERVDQVGQQGGEHG